MLILYLITIMITEHRISNTKKTPSYNLIKYCIIIFFFFFSLFLSFLFLPTASFSFSSHPQLQPPTTRGLQPPTMAPPRPLTTNNRCQFAAPPSQFAPPPPLSLLLPSQHHHHHPSPHIHSDLCSQMHHHHLSNPVWLFTYHHGSLISPSLAITNVVLTTTTTSFFSDQLTQPPPPCFFHSDFNHHASFSGDNASSLGYVTEQEKKKINEVRREKRHTVTVTPSLII